MPGVRSSAGTGGTFQSPVLMPLAGGWAGGSVLRAGRAGGPRRGGPRRAWRGRGNRSCRPTRNVAERGREELGRPVDRSELHARPGRTSAGARRGLGHRIAILLRWRLPGPVSPSSGRSPPRRGWTREHAVSLRMRRIDEAVNGRMPPQFHAPATRLVAGAGVCRRRRRRARSAAAEAAHAPGALERGGRGPARRLNDSARRGGRSVRITPMFGRWGYFAGDSSSPASRCAPRSATSGCVCRWPSRPRRSPGGVRPHRRFGRAGLDRGRTSRPPAESTAALRWLRRALRGRPRRAGGPREDEDAGIERRGRTGPRVTASGRRGLRGARWASIRSMPTSGTRSQASAVMAAEMRIERRDSRRQSYRRAPTFCESRACRR